MTQQLILLGVGTIVLAAGAILGYLARQSIAKKRSGTIEQKLQKKVADTKKQAEKIIQGARDNARQIQKENQEEIDQRRREILKTEKLLYNREHTLEQKISDLEDDKANFRKKVKKLKKIKEDLEGQRQEIERKMENVSGMSRSKAKEELIKEVEKDSLKEINERIKKLQNESQETYRARAREIILDAIQSYAFSQAQEITTTTLPIPSDDIKGRIIGKEGRNIKTLEQLTGVEVVVDDTPETVIISGFNPIRREIAKRALEKLIKDGRIQPARIEEQVKKAEQEIDEKIEEYGKNAAYNANVLDLPAKVIKLLGRLYFRTSYGQNVLLHSLEVAHLSAAIASEVGANIKIARKAGLLHDIGKSMDREVEGSHVNIGIKILEKLGIEKEIITAMKAHHEEYEAETPEAMIVKAADQISGARPGARKDTVENYLKRLEDLENIASSFPEVEKAYAIQAGREIRVFVRPEKVGDLEAHKMAKDIAERIWQELNYPGEIKVSLIREMRVVEYAK